MSVTASTQYENLAVAGSFGINFSTSTFIETSHSDDPKTGGLGNASKSLVNPLGNSGNNAIGASAFIDVLNNTTTAKIDTGAKIVVGSAGSLDVGATQQVFAGSLVQSGGAGGNLGVAGMLAWYNVTDHTTAQIEDGVTVNGGVDSGGNPTQGGSVQVQADDNAVMVGVTGGVVTSSHTGVGFAMAVNNLNRTTLALIGRSPSDSTTDPLAKGNFDVSALNVTATQEGLVTSITFSAAVISPDEDQVSANNKSRYSGVSASIFGSKSFAASGFTNPSAGQTGIGFAGAVSVNILTGDTEAYINDPGNFTTPSTGAALSLDPTAQPTSVIHFPTASNLVTGTPVVYTALSPIGGLTSGNTYYVIATDSFDIELAQTADDATNGNAITLDPSQANSADVQTLTSSSAILTFFPAAVEATVLDFPNGHGLATGQTVEYTAGSTPIGGLTSGTKYYAIVVNSNEIELAGSLADARDGTAITLDFSKATGNQVFVPILFGINAATGTLIVSVAGGVALSQQQLNSDKSNNAIAGALGINIVTDTTKAYLENATVTAAQIDVAADHGGRTISLAVGAAGASPSAAVGGGGSSNAVAGSVTINVDLPDTEAFVKDAHLTLGSDSWVTANEASWIVGIAGSGAYGGSNGFGVAIAINLIGFDIALTSEPALAAAYIEGSTVTLAGGTLSVLATDSDPTSQPRIIAIAGSGGIATGEDSNAGAGMISVNDIQDETNAYIESSTIAGPSGTAAPGNLFVEATDSSGIIAIGGALGVGGKNGLGAAIAYNEIAASTSAYIDSSNINFAGSVTVQASDTALIGAATIGIGATTGSGGLAGAGSVSINEITDTTLAYISNAEMTGSSVSAGGAMTVKATDTSTIGTGAGGVAGSAQGTAVGAAISYNLIQNSIAAYIDDSTVNSGGDLELLATSSPELIAIAVGAAGTGDGLALGGSITVNSVANDVDAHIDDSTVTAGGSVSVLAIESAIMEVDAAALPISSEGGSDVGAIAYNYIGGNFDPANPDLTDRASTATSSSKHQVSATITGSRVTAKGGNVSVEADFGPPPELPGTSASLDFGFTTVAIPIAVSSELVSVTVGVAGAQGIAVAGSLNLNFVRESVVASISGDSTGLSVVQASGAVFVSASDSATIVAVGGGLGIGVGLGGDAGVAVGLSAAHNDIANLVEAYVDGSTVTAHDGDITVQALEGATIQAWTIGGAIGVSVGGADGVGVGLAGAGSGNNIDNTVKAYAQDAATLTAQAGDVSLLASDAPSITANGGGVAVAVGVGTGVGVAASVGVGFAINSITDTVEAFVDSSNVTASSTVTITATESAQIGGLTIGGAIAGGGGGLGLGVAAAGSGTVNNITDKIEAYVNGTSASVTAQNGPVSITATDNTVITSSGGGVAISAGIGVGVGGALALGVAVVTNTVDNHVLAYVDGSSVTATGGDVKIESTENVTITSVSAGGAASIAGGSTVAVAGAASGANTTNNLDNFVEAYLQGGATITTTTSGDVIVKATDTPNITATAGAGSVAIAASAGGSGTLAIGGAVADNIITDTVQASSDSSTISSAGNVNLAASANPTATAVSIAASVAGSISAIGIAFSGAGASSTNTITDNVETFITGASPTSPSTVKAATQVSMSATESGSISATVGAGALSFAPIGASIGISLATNQINSTIEASVDNVSITAGSIQITATATDKVQPVTTVATSVAPSLAGAGGNASSTVDPIVQTYVGSGAVLDATSGDVSISSSSNGTANSSNSDYSIGFIAVGDSHAEATIGNSAPSNPTVQVASFASFPTTGTNLVVVGTDSSNLFHIEIFDNTGKLITQNTESGLPSSDATAITNLKQQISGYSSSLQPTAAQQAQLLAEISAILQPQVQVVSWGDGSSIPTGDNLLVIGVDSNKKLHIRIFDVCGNIETDLTESQLPVSQAEAIAALKQQVEVLSPPVTLTGTEAASLFAEATALASIVVSTLTFVAPGASITAEVGNLSVTATSIGSASATASAASGGVGVGAASFATTTFTNPADVEVGAGSTLKAPFGTLLVKSATGTNASSTATSTNGGVVAVSDSTATTTVDSEATTSVDSGANLSAAILHVSAADAPQPSTSSGGGGGSTPTSNRSATATATSSATAVVPPTDATATLTATYVSQVNVASGANLTGDSAVQLTSASGSIDVNSDPSATADGVGQPTAHPTNTLNYSSDITAAPGSTITAGTLDVSSTTPGPTVETGSAAATKTATNQIQFNSNVTILGAAPELKIGPTGNLLVDVGSRVHHPVQSDCS